VSGPAAAPDAGRQHCALCGGERFDRTLAAFDRQVARSETYAYGRCTECSLLSLRPTPRDDEIPGFYPADYSPHEALQEADGGRSRSPGPLARFAPWHRFVAGWLPRDLFRPRGRSRLLDVGCGNGRLLARHRALGWEVRGIDPGERAVAACRQLGLSVEQAGLLDADLPSRHFDVILLHHVIEHVPRPLEALRRARELLAPGGAIVVVTPNAASLGFRMYGACWYALDAPRHLQLFDRGTLVRLSHGAGLSVESMRTTSSARVLAASRLIARSQGPTLPPGLAERTAALARTHDDVGASRRFRRVVRPVAWLAARLGHGETLRATLVDRGQRARPSAGEPDA
jgi:SAM-dependent methyltransferase